MATTTDYPIYWASVAVGHLTDNSNTDARLWWPCVAYSDYPTFLEATHMEGGKAINKRVIENMLEGKRVSILKLFGREEYVEIVHPQKVHRGAAGNEEHQPEDIHAHQTLWQVPFASLDQEELLAQLDPSVFQEEQALYKSFMTAMDLVRGELNDDIASQAFAVLGEQQWQRFRGGALQQEASPAVGRGLQQQAVAQEEEQVAAAAAEEQEEQPVPQAAAMPEAAAPPAAAAAEDTAMEEDKAQEEAEPASQDKDETSVAAVSVTGTVVTHDSEQEQPAEKQQDPGIRPRDSFADTLHKLQLCGWDNIQYQGKAVWMQPGKDPSSNESLVLGKDYFDEAELKEYLQAKFGWKRPQVDAAAPPQTTTGKKKPGRKPRNNNNMVTPSNTTGKKKPGRKPRNTMVTPSSNKQKTKTPQTKTTGKKKASKKPRNNMVTPSPKARKESSPTEPLRSSKRNRIEPGILDDEEILDRAKKQQKKFYFNSEEEFKFYDFGRLMRKLKQQGWKYGGGKLGGWAYTLPGHKGPMRGGVPKVDYFDEEDDVIEYCMKNNYYARRHELGLAK